MKGWSRHTSRSAGNRGDGADLFSEAKLKSSGAIPVVLLSIDLKVAGATAELEIRTFAAGVAKTKVLEGKISRDGRGAVADTKNHKSADDCTKVLVDDSLSTGNGEIRRILTSQSAAINGDGWRNTDLGVSPNTIVNEDISSGAGHTAILEELASGTGNGEGMCGLRTIWVKGSGDVGTAGQRSGTRNQGRRDITTGVASDGGSIGIDLSVARNDRDEASLQFGVDVHSLVVTRAAADPGSEVTAANRAVEELVLASGNARKQYRATGGRLTLRRKERDRHLEWSRQHGSLQTQKSRRTRS